MWCTLEAFLKTINEEDEIFAKFSTERFFPVFFERFHDFWVQKNRILFYHKKGFRDISRLW